MAERILCILGKLRAGGVESVMYTYYRHLDKSKYQFDFVYEESSDLEVPSELTDMGAKAIKIPNIGSPIKYMKAIIRIIKQGDYNIIHSNLNTLSVFSLFSAKLCGVKYRILHNHTTSSPVEKKRTLLKKLLRPFNLLFMNVPCACSELSAQWMYGKKSVEEGRAVIINNGIDVGRFRYDEQNREDIRRLYGIENKKVIGHVGRFATTKNHLFIIDILEKCLSEKEGACLLLVGSGELFEEVKAYVEKKKLQESVIFAGVCSDVYRYYSAFDVFILPSLYEGLPVVAMEATASGLPVLLSDKITRECAISDNVSYLPINDPSVWAKKICSSEAGDREKYAQLMKGGKFDISVCAKELEELYNECK